MHRRRLAAILAASLLTSTLSLPTWAAPTAADLAAAKQHFDRGVKLYDETDWQGALVEFKRAHALSGRWELLFNIGYAQFQMQNYAGALATFERYLSEGADKVPADKRERVNKDLTELRGRVGKLTIHVDVAGADVFVDDQLVGKAPLAAAIVVSTGARKVTARVAGRPEVAQTIEIAAGDDSKLELHVPEATTTTTSKEAPLRTTWTVSTWTWVGAGVGAVGLGVGAAFGLVALGNKSDLDAVCQAKHCDVTQQGKIDSLNRNATISTIGFIVGGVGAGITIYGLLNPNVKSERAPATGGVTVHPWIGVGSAGLVGSF